MPRRHWGGCSMNSATNARRWCAGTPGYGNEGILLTLEERKQPYLLRLRQTKNVQRLVAQQFARQDWSRPDNQGCQMVEAQLQLHGWSARRRVVIVRQRIRGGIARERRVDGKQLKLDLAGPQRARGRQAVGVRGAGHRRCLPAGVRRPALPGPRGCGERVRRAEEPVGPGWVHHAGHQPLPDRGPCVCAGLQLVELVLPSGAPHGPAGGDHKPAAAAGRGGQGGQPRQPDDAVPDADARPSRRAAKRLLANIGTALQHVKAAAEQFKDLDRWGCLLRYISDRIAPVIGPPKPFQGLPAVG
jgi:hypothetical protein